MRLGRVRRLIRAFVNIFFPEKKIWEAMDGNTLTLQPGTYMMGNGEMVTVARRAVFRRDIGRWGNDPVKVEERHPDTIFLLESENIVHGKYLATGKEGDWSEKEKLVGVYKRIDELSPNL